ncbi:MAG: hypothetical protein AAF587_40925 [Bacteroidota bacterium]
MILLNVFPKPILSLLWIGFASSLICGQTVPTAVWVQDGHTWNVQLQDTLWEAGMEEAPNILSVYVGEKAPFTKQPAILGSYTSVSGVLTFTPRFPFRPNLSYRAQYKSSEPILFRIPQKAPKEAARVLSIYPSVDSLPANQLKLFIHFSQPMRQGVAYEHLLWSDESGEALPSPFLELQPELWDETGRILTLWFDPGRVKRALGPNKIWGAPMEEGHLYHLSIDSTWTTTEGYPLTHGIHKSIFAVAEDRGKPDVSDWTISSPSEGTRIPLVIEFGESMDHLLLTKTFLLKNSQNEVIQGKIDIGRAEKSWYFFPDLPWQKDQYRLVIESRLEDLAGNNLNRLFDQEMSQKVDQPTDQDVYELLLSIE